MMKTMYSLLIYIKAMGYVYFKYFIYIYLCGELNLTYIACNLIEQ